jgi:hypothetical protein
VSLVSAVAALAERVGEEFGAARLVRLLTLATDPFPAVPGSVWLRSTGEVVAHNGTTVVALGGTLLLEPDGVVPDGTPVGTLIFRKQYETDGLPSPRTGGPGPTV